MPFEMHGYVQSVVVQGSVYVGEGNGGNGSPDNNCIVMKFDTILGKWITLPPYGACDFAMAVVNNQLVLVGGKEHDGGRINALEMWKPEDNRWTYPFPSMPTARSGCSAIVYNEWLVVAGGWSGGTLSKVEVMNISHNIQWYVGPPTPVSWINMKPALVDDTCYFTGGEAGGA